MPLSHVQSTHVGIFGLERTMKYQPALNTHLDSNRRSFIGGTDARIIMGNDETALVQLWREKRGEAEPEDLSGNLMGGLPRT
jgi:predicted phage-related endonuclease